MSDRLLIGAQNICKPLEADTGERLLPDQLIVCRREILSSVCVIHPCIWPQNGFLERSFRERCYRFGKGLAVTVVTI